MILLMLIIYHRGAVLFYQQTQGAVSLYFIR